MIIKKMKTSLKKNLKISQTKITASQTARIQILQSHSKIQRKIQTNLTLIKIAIIVIHLITTSIDASSKTLLNNQKNDNSEKRAKLNISKRDMKVSKVSIH